MLQSKLKLSSFLEDCLDLGQASLRIKLAILIAEQLLVLLDPLLALLFLLVELLKALVALWISLQVRTLGELLADCVYLAHSNSSLELFSLRGVHTLSVGLAVDWCQVTVQLRQLLDPLFLLVLLFRFTEGLVRDWQARLFDLLE